MISYLKGNVLFKEPSYLTLLVGQVGYKVFVAEKFLARISHGQELELFCSLEVKENGLELYGFPSKEVLAVFEVLNSISGIGPKTALILSSLGSIDELRKAIQKGDAGFFAGVKGIGEKKIQKIMVELTGKLAPTPKKTNASDEALDALLNLGFSRQDAKEALSKVSGEIQNSQERVRAALKLLGR